MKFCGSLLDSMHLAKKKYLKSLDSSGHESFVLNFWVLVPNLLLVEKSSSPTITGQFINICSPVSATLLAKVSLKAYNISNNHLTTATKVQFVQWMIFNSQQLLNLSSAISYLPNFINQSPQLLLNGQFTNFIFQFQCYAIKCPIYIIQLNWF